MINLEDLLISITRNINKKGIVKCELERCLKHLSLGISDYIYNLNVVFVVGKNSKITVDFITWDEIEVKVTDVSFNCKDSLDAKTTSYRYFDLNETEFLNKVSASLDNVYYIQRHYSELVKINYQNRRKQELEKDFEL